MSSAIFSPVSLLIILAVMVILSSTIIEGIATENHSVYASPSPSPPPPSTATLSNFNFAAVGDTNCNSITENIVEDIQAKAPEIVLGLGDYIYNDDSADCWLEIIEPIDNIMKIAIGNHEIGAILTELMEHYGLTDQYYSFDYQNVHITVMSDYVPDEIGSEQHDFVQNDLAKAAADPNIDWIVVSHHSQKYASTQNYDIPDENEWNTIYHPLFEQYNVDLVLQGHQHNYQRTYPIKYNIDTPINPIITDRNRSTYTNPEGQIYLTVGTGGASLHSLNGNKAPYIITAQDEVYGFLNVDITNNNNDGTTTLVGTFYSNNGGEMTDQFTITKSTAENSLPIPPDLPVQETDGIEEADAVQLDNAPVSEESENIDATAAEDVEQEEEEEGDDNGGGTDEGE
jgi:predicted MPP superfamily phosphohydrolase